MIHARDTERLQKLDMTTYRQLVGMRLLVVTGAVVGSAFIMEILGPDKAKAWAMKILEMWLWFMAGVLGIGTGQYGLQRFSSKEYVGAKPPPVPPSGVSIDTQGGDANVQAPMRPSQAMRAVMGEDEPGPVKPDGHEWADGDPRAGVL